MAFIGQPLTHRLADELALAEQMTAESHAFAEKVTQQFTTIARKQQSTNSSWIPSAHNHASHLSFFERALIVRKNFESFIQTNR